MTQGYIEVTCNNCKCTRFTVLEPKPEWPKESKYFTCPSCIYNKNRELNSRYKIYMMTGVIEGDDPVP